MAEEKGDNKELTWTAFTMIFVSIPNERKAILIGKDGTTKIKLEKKTGTKITVADEVAIEGDWETEVRAAEVVKAIGRGFSPSKALSLTRKDIFLDVISLKGSPNTIKRLMARVIGTSGKAKANIERFCGVSISVYGKTVSIIGTESRTRTARTAVEMILAGRMHNYVWRYLEGETEEASEKPKDI